MAHLTQGSYDDVSKDNTAADVTSQHFGVSRDGGRTAGRVSSLQSSVHVFFKAKLDYVLSML